MNEMFDVGVRIRLIDRASRDLLRLGGLFGRTETAAAGLRRELGYLERTRLLSMRRAQLSERMDRAGLQILYARQAAVLREGASAETLAKNRALNEQIATRTERASIRRTAEQLALQRSITKETQLRAAIEAETAASAARSTMWRGGLELAGGVIGLDFAKHITMAAAKLQTRERFLEAIYGMTPQQTHALRMRAFTLQQTLGNISAGDVEQMLLVLRGAGVSGRTANAVLPEVARIADVLYSVRGTSLDQTAKQLGQFANLFGARTAAQFKPIAELLMKASLLAPGSMSELLTQSSYLAPLLRQGFSWRNLIQLAVTTQREGGRGAISPENLATVIARLQLMQGHLGPFAVGGRAWIGASRLGLPQFEKEHPHFTLQQFETFLEQRRKLLGTRRFTTDASLAFGLAGLRTVLQLSTTQTVHELARVVAQLKKMGSSAKVNAARLDTLDGQLKLVHSNLHSLSQALGQPLVGPLQTLNAMIARLTAGAIFATKHATVLTDIAVQIGATTALFGSMAGALRLVGGALEFAAARGFLTGATRFATGIEAIADAISAALPLVLAAEAASKLAHHVGKSAALANPLIGGYGSVGQSGWSLYQHFYGHAPPLFAGYNPPTPEAKLDLRPVHIHLHGTPNPRAVARELIIGLRNGSLGKGGTARPMSVSGHMLHRSPSSP